MTTPNIPNKPPAAEGDLGAVLSHINRKQMQRVDGQLPAVVLAYNRVTNRAMVQPLISLIATDGTRISRAPIASVPVLALGGGGYFVNFPLAEGDLGWIEASDRDISLYMQTKQDSPPNSLRMHDFSDGRFIPDVFAGYDFTLDADSMVLGTLDGVSRVVIGRQTITLNAPTVIVNATTETHTVAGVLTLNAAILDINTTETTGTTGTGAFNLPTNTTIGGRPFMTHEHSGVQEGNDNSGAVV